MRIEEIREESVDGRRRVSARLVWESSPRPPDLLYFENHGASDLPVDASPDAFVLACLPLAMARKETRVAVEGSVCTRLRDGLAAAAEIYRGAYRDFAPLSVEPSHGFRPTTPLPRRHSASFMSGGLDALSVLRANRIDYPAEHPLSIRTCILVYGLNFYDFLEGRPREERIVAFETHVRRLKALGASAGFDLVPIRTNVRTLYPSFSEHTPIAWYTALASAALTLRNHVTDVLLGSAGAGMNVPTMQAAGVLAHHYSTEGVTLRLAQPAMTRLDKLRMIADWHEGLAVLKPCVYIELPREGFVNCGRCEKCVRTLLGFAALGKPAPSSFPPGALTPEMLSVVPWRHERDEKMYAELIEPLRAAGRADLARVLEADIAALKKERSKGRVRRRIERFVQKRIATLRRLQARVASRSTSS
jgi:hypothetical protein